MGEFKDVDLRDPSAHSLDVEAAASGPSKAKRQHASSPAAGDASVDEPLGSRSVFDLYTRRRKNALLLVCAISMLLVPICDTIYLPSLTVVERDLKASPESAAASVSVYMYMVGLGALFLGPLADRVGRRPTLCGATALFTALSVVCVFAPNIQFLLAFRAAQGFIVSACSTTSSAILADVFAPEERGRAMGLAAIPFLVGPVAGPLLGGALSQQLGWRSTFVALAIFGAVALTAQIFVVQETHHYFAVRRLERAEGPAAAAAIREPIPRPAFAPPHRPLVHLFDAQLAPHVLVSTLLFSVMFAAMIVLPIVLSKPAYRLGEALIGVANGLPFGLGGLLAAPVGGLLADWCAKRFCAAPAGRMAWGAGAAVAVFPAATLLFGLGMHYRLNLAVPLLGGFFINAAMTSHLPATQSLISIRKQQAAASAGGGLHALQFILAGTFVQVTPLGVQTMGVAGFMGMCAGIVFVAAAGAWVPVASAIRGTRRQRRAEGGGGGGGGGDEGAAEEAPDMQVIAGDTSTAGPTKGAVGGGGGGGGERAAVVAPAAAAARPQSPAAAHRRTSLEAALEGIAGLQAA